MNGDAIEGMPLLWTEICIPSNARGNRLGKENRYMTTETLPGFNKTFYTIKKVFSVYF